MPSPRYSSESMPPETTLQSHSAKRSLKQALMENQRFIILAACCVGMSMSFTTLFTNTLPVLMKSMAAANGWTRTEASGGVSAAFWGLSLGYPLAGRLMDRFGARRIMLISGILMTLLLYIFSLQSGSIYVYLALAATIGLCAFGTTSVNYSFVIAKWFDHRLGLALCIGSIGLGVGYTLAPVLSAHWLQTLGWRNTFVILSLLAAISLINTFLFVREPVNAKPRSKSTLAEAASPHSGMSLREAMRTRAFWMLSISALLVSASLTGTTVHLVPLLSDRGYPLEAAARASALWGISVLVARVVAGILLDHIRTTFVAAASFIAGAVGIATLLLSAHPQAPFVAALCIGLAVGSETDIMPFACRRYFGLRAYGQIYGVVAMVFALGVVAGPLLMAGAFEHSGGYGRVLPVFTGLCVIAAIAALAMGQPSFQQRK